MFMIGLLTGIVVKMVTSQPSVWSALETAFLCVFFTGLISIVVIEVLKRQITNKLAKIVFGELCRTTLIGIVFVIIVFTQTRQFTISMVCFSIVFYLGMVVIITWQMLSAQHNHHETSSNRE